MVCPKADLICFSTLKCSEYFGFSRVEFFYDFSLSGYGLDVSLVCSRFFVVHLYIIKRLVEHIAEDGGGGFGLFP